MNRQQFKAAEAIEAEKACRSERAEDWVAPRATAACPVPIVVHRPPMPEGTPMWAILSDIGGIGESLTVRMR